MGFSAKQVQALRRNLDPRRICKREANGRELSYIEGWYAISEANRIFGFDGWSRETIESKCIVARENRGTFVAVYTARVRITVQADGVAVVREGQGTGQGHGYSPGEVHDVGLKAAETDATKRALVTFGKPFGLSLYGSDKKARGQKASIEESKRVELGQNGTVKRDGTTPIPQISGYRDGQKNLVTRDLANAQAFPKLGDQAWVDTSRIPHASGFLPTRIDKSVLTIAEPKRLRDKAHLRFVASQPCLVCGRQPSDPHHLQFAQPRALGLKVSDEFTVPLCRGHHRQLHQAGNEVTWWDDLDINALEIANGLWEESRSKRFPATAPPPRQQANAGSVQPAPIQDTSKLPNEPN